MSEKHHRTFASPPCRNYMYELKWIWSEEDKKRCIFIMLNPARTTNLAGNKTVKKCKAIAVKEKCDGMILLDLFPYVAGNWEGLRDAEKQGKDIVKEKKHDKHLRRALATENALIIMAWGEDRDEKFKDLVGFQRQIDNVKRIIRDYVNKGYIKSEDVMQLEKVGKGGRITHPVRLNNEDYKLTKFDCSE